MKVVEVFMPLDTGHGEPIPPEIVEGLVAGLSERFGGATAYTREPAVGLWKQSSHLVRDRILVIEIMVDELDEQWWHDYRRRLEREFAQESVLIRTTQCQTI